MPSCYGHIPSLVLFPEQPRFPRMLLHPGALFAPHRRNPQRNPTYHAELVHLRATRRPTRTMALARGKWHARAHTAACRSCHAVACHREQGSRRDGRPSAQLQQASRQRATARCSTQTWQRAPPLASQLPALTRAGTMTIRTPATPQRHPTDSLTHISATLPQTRPLPLAWGVVGCIVWCGWGTAHPVPHALVIHTHSDT